MAIVFVRDESGEVNAFPMPPEPIRLQATVEPSTTLNYVRQVGSFGGMAVVAAGSTQTGTFTLEGSHDGTTWVKLVDTTLSSIVSGFYGYGVELPWSLPWLRLRVSNTGAVDATVDYATGFVREV